MLDPRDPVRDLPAHELDAAYRRLMVKQDASTREHPVTLAVVDRRPVGQRACRWRGGFAGWGADVTDCTGSATNPNISLVDS